MANYRKNTGDRLRCNACGSACEYCRGRTAVKVLTMHIGLNKQCNRYYNEEAVAAAKRRGHLGP